MNKAYKVHKGNKAYKENKVYKGYKAFKGIREHKAGLATRDYGPKPGLTRTATSCNGIFNYGPFYASRDKLAGKACQMASSAPTFINFAVNKENKGRQECKAYKAYKVYKGYKA